MGERFDKFKGGLKNGLSKTGEGLKKTGKFGWKWTKKGAKGAMKLAKKTLDSKWFGSIRGLLIDDEVYALLTNEEKNFAETCLDDPVKMAFIFRKLATGTVTNATPYGLAFKVIGRVASKKLLEEGQLNNTSITDLQIGEHNIPVNIELLRKLSDPEGLIESEVKNRIALAIPDNKFPKGAANAIKDQLEKPGGTKSQTLIKYAQDKALKVIGETNETAQVYEDYLSKLLVDKVTDPTTRAGFVAWYRGKLTAASKLRTKYQGKDEVPVEYQQYLARLIAQAFDDDGVMSAAERKLVAQNVVAWEKRWRSAIGVPAGAPQDFQPSIQDAPLFYPSENPDEACESCEFNTCTEPDYGETLEDIDWEEFLGYDEGFYVTVFPGWDADETTNLDNSTAVVTGSSPMNSAASGMFTSSGKAQFKWNNGWATNGAYVTWNFSDGLSHGLVEYSLRNHTHGDFAKRSPKAWSLSGSHDGQAWLELDYRDDQTWSAKSEVKTFSVEEPGKYRHYKLKITEKPSGHKWLGELAELTFKESSDPFPTSNDLADNERIAPQEAGSCIMKIRTMIFKRVPNGRDEALTGFYIYDTIHECNKCAKIENATVKWRRCGEIDIDFNIVGADMSIASNHLGWTEPDQPHPDNVEEGDLYVKMRIVA